MQTASIGIQAKREAKEHQQFAQLLRELIAQYDGMEQGNTAPPLDIKKLLLELAQNVNPRVHVPQDSIQSQAPPPYPPLSQVTKPNLTTKELAYYSDMAEQTWRVKACYETFPDGLRPLRVCGKLAWPTAGAKKLLGVA